MTTKTSLFQLQSVESAEDELFLVEMGTAIFQSALITYLAECKDKEADGLERFVDQNAGTQTFLEDLCKEYPDFADILAEEINRTRKEFETEN